MAGTPTTVIIGLTGGVGAGKSSVEQLCRGWGIPTADADRWVHEILEHDESVQQQIVTYFKNEYEHRPLLSDGRIDRKYIASKAFKAPRTLKFMESLLHPRVIEKAERWIQQQRALHVPVALLVVPLLLESGMDVQCDLVVALAVTEKTRIDRLQATRGWTPEESWARMQHQLDEKTRCARADSIVTNEGTPDELAATLEEIIQNVGSLICKKNRNMNQ